MSVRENVRKYMLKRTEKYLTKVKNFFETKTHFWACSQFHQHFTSSVLRKSLFRSFLYWRLRFVFCWQKEIGAKAVCKTLVKLTPDLLGPREKRIQGFCFFPFVRYSESGNAWKSNLIGIFWSVFFLTFENDGKCEKCHRVGLSNKFTRWLSEHFSALPIFQQLTAIC